MKNILLASDYKAYSKIVLAENASDSAKYGARQLKRYLERITSATFEYAPDGTTDPSILIGYGKSAAALEFIKASCELGDDGFVIKTSGAHLLIDGGALRGIAYGCYELLEQLGCRFFTATCEKIPSSLNLEVPALNLCQKPILEYREHFYREYSTHPDFAVKSRNNGNFPEIPEEMGGHFEYAYFVHSFSPILVNPKEWFEDHPEYFSLVNGKRIKDYTQLCLTNPDVLRISIENTKKCLREHPHAKIISISQNDWYNPCECDACKAIDDREDSHAGTLIEFVNKIAEAIEPEFPDVIVDTLAYQYTRTAPKHIKPRHNVCVRLCSIECCFTHEIDQCEATLRPVTRQDGTTSHFSQDIKDWSKISDRLYVWDYVTDFAHYSFPFPNWNILQHNLQFLVEHSVKGVFEQGNNTLNGGFDANELRAYLVSKLLWDPYCDVAALRKEFIDYFYGAAADAVDEYIKLYTETAYQGDSHCFFCSNPETAHLSFEMLDRYDEILDRALCAVQADPFRLIRVNRLKMATRYIRLKKLSVEKDSVCKEEIDQWITDCYSYGIRRVEESAPLDYTRASFFAHLKRGTDFITDWDHFKEEDELVKI